MSAKSKADKVKRALIEQRFFKAIRKKAGLAAGAVREEADRRLGMAAREIEFANLPIQENKVFFHTQESLYCCNPKYIAEVFRRQGFDGLDVVWRCPTNSRGGVPDDFRTVGFNTYEYFKELATAKVIVTNSFLYFSMPVRLKEGQILLQTWHGSLGIKRYGAGDMKDSKRRLNALEDTARMTDYCISNSKLENNSFRDHFWPDTPILQYGHARNDLFFDNHKQDRADIRARLIKAWQYQNPGLHVDEETRFVMYAPTFRDDKSFAPYNVDYARLLDALKQRFGGNWCVILRFHPSMAKLKDVNERVDELLTQGVPLINATGYTDMQELIAVTDVAITDYSSWIYDFVLLRRPGFIFATDIADYDEERGFYYPIRTTPFPVCSNNDELIESILAFEDEPYAAKVESFLQDKGCWDDGHAGERAARLICDLLMGKKPDDALPAGQR